MASMPVICMEQDALRIGPLDWCRLFGLILSATVSFRVRAAAARRRLRRPIRRASALAQRIAHTDPSRYRSSPARARRAGTLDYFALFNADAIDTNLQFLHRGVIQPKSGIGQHFHNYCEEMFVILDGEAQFTDRRPHLDIEGPGRGAGAHGPRACDLQRHRQAGAVAEHQRRRRSAACTTTSTSATPASARRSIRCRSS